MKIFNKSIILLVGITAMASATLQCQEDQQNKTQILILGSYHMNNPGQDIYNIEADDVLTEKRQKEIQELVDQLAQFKPTKIAIERRWQTKYDTLAQQKYLQYKAGKHALDRGEDQQIGYRLAKKLGHERIYCIDAPGNFDFNKVVTFANENGQEGFFQETDEWMQEKMKEEAIFMQENDISTILLHDNDPQVLKEGHAIYISMLQIGKGKEYPGAELTSDWYERNMKIFSNLIHITNPQDDRVLVIFGSGHAPILRELVQYYPDFELVELSTILNDK